ncbi:hypothetical protein M433DRAFT_9348 [Acidomyces richmondensis BFW]|nr:hypothetical protein M433DRAFT_9348 [Acidomyces richmondensis BFW]
MSNNITTTLPVPMNEKSSGEREQLAAETLDERLQRAREKRDRLVGLWRQAEAVVAHLPR